MLRDATARTRSRIACLALVAGIMAAGTVVASEDILIRNVTLMDPAGMTNDRVVSLLIRNEVLDVVTEDDVAGDQFDHAFDAAGGFVIGNLKVGAAPNLVIVRISIIGGWRLRAGGA